MKDFSYITNSHPSYIENLYQDFLKDPNSIDPDLKKFFEGFDFATGHGSNNGRLMAQQVPPVIQQLQQPLLLEM